MTDIPKTCIHGVPLFGNPIPDCLLCDLVYEELMVEHHRKQLTRGRARIAAIKNALKQKEPTK